MPLIGSSFRGFGQMTVPRPTNMRVERETDRDREMEGYPILSVSHCFHHFSLGLFCSHQTRSPLIQCLPFPIYSTSCNQASNDFPFVFCSTSHNAVLRETAPMLPENLLEMYYLRPHLGHESDALGWRPSNLCFNGCSR